MTTTRKISYAGIDLEVEYGYTRPEPATRETPGDPGGYEVVSVRLVNPRADISELLDLEKVEQELEDAAEDDRRHTPPDREQP